MTLVRFSPVRDLVTTRNRLERMFDAFFNDRSGNFYSPFGNWAPEVDVEETADAIVLRADLPGMKKKDLQISVENNHLTIRGERKSEQDPEQRNFRCIERSHGMFARSFALPTTVQSDKVEATYRDGVLEVVVPKAEEVKPRQIDIK